MTIFYVAKFRIPTLRANSVQMFHSCEALTRLGAGVFMLGEHRGLKPASEAAPHHWPLQQLDYHGVEPIFPLIYPRQHWWHFLGKRAAKLSFARACLDVVASRGAEDAIVYTRIPLVAHLAALRGLNTVLEVHGTNVTQDENWKGFRTLVAQNRHRAAPFAGIVAISETLASELELEVDAPQNFLIAHSGITLERFGASNSTGAARAELRQIDPALEIGDKDFVVGYCGHLYAGRGIEMLIECARRRPQWKFLVVGGMKKALETYRTLASQQGTSNMIFTGYINNSELTPYLQACDALTMPYEAGPEHSNFMSPMKMFEYMASHRPIVAADWPQIAEVLQHDGNALLHERSNARMLEQQLDQVSQSPALGAMLSQAARRDVGNYSWQARAQKIMAWLENRALSPVG